MKKTCALLASALMLLTLGGCYDYSEINSRAIVAGLAIDRLPSDGPGDMYAVTTEIVLLSEGTQAAPERRLARGSAPSTFGAYDNIARISGRELYFGHMQLIVLSEQIARDGIAQFLNAAARDNHIRLSVKPIVSVLPSAADALEIQPLTQSVGSYEMSQIIAAAAHAGQTPDMPLHRFISELEQSGVEPVLPVAGVRPNDGSDTIDVHGAAIFRGDTMVGVMDAQMTGFLLLLRGEFDTAGFTAPREEADGGDVTFRISHTEISVTPTVSGERIACDVRVRCVADIAQTELRADVANRASNEQLERLAEQTLTRKIEQLLRALQGEYRADSIGVGREIARTDAAAWQRLAPAWDEWFPRVAFAVTVDAKLYDDGRTSRISN